MRWTHLLIAVARSDFRKTCMIRMGVIGLCLEVMYLFVLRSAANGRKVKLIIVLVGMTV